MPFDVLLPQWGMGMNDGMVVKWLKQEGESVQSGEPLVEIESSKVNGEVEAPGGGTLGRILVGEGTTVPTGSVLGIVLAEGETSADLPETGDAGGGGATGTQPSPQPSPTGRGGMAASPTGQGGDEASAAEARGDAVGAEESSGPSTALGTGSQPTPGERGSSEDGQEVRRVVRLTGLRGAVGRRMTESAGIPAVTLTSEVDVTGASELLGRLVREWRPHRLRPQLQDIVLTATARALRDHPRANSHLIENEVREMAHVNLGLALSMPEGLLVPVIHDADRKSLLEIAQHVREVSRRIRDGYQTVEDLSRGTFTVTALGGFGIDAFNPLLNPPQVGILALGRVVQKPAVVSGEVAVRSMAWLGITFDHRAWDGAPAGDFLRTVAKYVSDPSWMVD